MNTYKEVNDLLNNLFWDMVNKHSPEVQADILLHIHDQEMEYSRKEALAAQATQKIGLFNIRRA